MKSAQLNRAKGSRGNAPCGVQRRCLWWGLGQRPNCSTGDQFKGRSQQGRRQRSVPASNFALPQKRPQAALPTTCILSRRWARPASIERSFFLLLVFFVAGGRACGRDKGAMETDEVCGRPLDPFAVRSHVYCFFSLQGGTKGTLNYSNDKSQLWGRAAEEVQRAIGKPSGTMPMTRLEKKSTLLT